MSDTYALRGSLGRASDKLRGVNAVVELVGTLSLSSVAAMWRSDAMEGIVSFDTL